MSDVVECRLDNEKLLESLDHKLQQIRDRTQGVAKGYYNGFLSRGYRHGEDWLSPEESTEVDEWRLRNRLEGLLGEKALYRMLKKVPTFGGRLRSCRERSGASDTVTRHANRALNALGRNEKTFHSCRQVDGRLLAEAKY
jgi:hypothetical protein